MIQTKPETDPALQGAAATFMAETIGAVSAEIINELGATSAASSAPTPTPLEQAFIDLAQQRANRAARGRENTTRRGKNTAADNIWTRHHAICLMGAIGEVRMGGPAAARAVEEPLKQFDNLTADIPAVMLKLCPWMLNSVYLNLVGTADLDTIGLDQAFARWAANRVYYFYREPQHREHPRNRTKMNIKSAYAEFFDAFEGEIEAMVPIGQACAREFWLSVSDRVPFQEPVNASAPVQVLTEGNAGAQVSGGNLPSVEKEDVQ